MTSRPVCRASPTRLGMSVCPLPHALLHGDPHPMRLRRISPSHVWVVACRASPTRLGMTVCPLPHACLHGDPHPMRLRRILPMCGGCMSRVSDAFHPGALVGRAPRVGDPQDVKPHAAMHGEAQTHPNTQARRRCAGITYNTIGSGRSAHGGP